MTRSRACCLLLALAGLTGCGEDAPATPPGTGPADPLLRLDGIEVAFGELEPWLGMLERNYPRYSRTTKIRTVLEQHVLPLRLAQREFAAERQAMLERARDLKRVAGNAVELEQRAAMLPSMRKLVTPGDVPMPVAQFLFDPALTGAVSEPIELPQGWVVAAARDLRRGGVAADDQADAVVVHFFTHEPVAHRDWIERRQTELAGKASWAHPDHLQALPPWLGPPPKEALR